MATEYCADVSAYVVDLPEDLNIAFLTEVHLHPIAYMKATMHTAITSWNTKCNKDHLMLK